MAPRSIVQGVAPLLNPDTVCLPLLTGHLFLLIRTTCAAGARACVITRVYIGKYSTQKSTN